MKLKIFRINFGSLEGWLSSAAVFFAVLGTLHSEARESTGKRPRTMAQMSVAVADLDCVEKIADAKGKDPLAAANIKIRDPRKSLKPDERELMAGVVDRFRQLGAGHLIKDITVTIHPGGRHGGRRCSSFTSSRNSIELTTDCRNYDGEKSIKHFVHELGHIIGLRGFYAGWYKLPACRITRYAFTNRNEDFAEAIAIYFWQPEELKKRCPRAYQFVRNSGIFRTPGDPNICHAPSAPQVALAIAKPKLRPPDLRTESSSEDTVKIPKPRPRPQMTTQLEGVTWDMMIHSRENSAFGLHKAPQPATLELGPQGAR